MSTTLATIPQRTSLVEKFAGKYNLDPAKMMHTLKETAFKQKGRNAVAISNEQMAALLVVADQYSLNPFTKEIYAYPDNGGIVPVVGVDGWARIINEHPNADGLHFVESDEVIESAEHRTCPVWIECHIFRTDRTHPTIVREHFDEVYRPPFKQGMRGPWQTHTKRMMRHKVLIQAARLGFGFVGIHDVDEAERILAAEYDVVNRPEAAPPGATTTDKIKATLGIDENVEPAQSDTVVDMDTGEVIEDDAAQSNNTQGTENNEQSQ